MFPSSENKSQSAKSYSSVVKMNWQHSFSTNEGNISSCLWSLSLSACYNSRHQFNTTIITCKGNYGTFEGYAGAANTYFLFLHIFLCVITLCQSLFLGGRGGIIQWGPATHNSNIIVDKKTITFGYRCWRLMDFMQLTCSYFCWKHWKVEQASGFRLFQALAMPSGAKINSVF